MPKKGEVSPVFRKYVQPVGAGNNQVFAIVEVQVEYRGLDDEGEERATRRKRRIPVAMGYATRARTRAFTVEDVEDALRMRKGESMQVRHVLGFVQLQPRADRLKTGTFRSKDDARQGDRRVGKRSV